MADVSAIAPTFTTDRRAGEEPIPGYVLVEPLGRGGFGEVWKCVAPGGLHKAVKFVPGGGHQLRQEVAAFERVRAMRHAFLVTLERVELIDGDLVIVMELADAQLQDRFDECRREGRRGIPRDELLRYLADAAEALDVIAARYELQHLDVKPANLFLIDGHVKVGDYGLVRALGAGPSQAGLTPKYAAPEVLRGNADARSDQYSLALVYHELLTGAFPFSGRTAQQLMLQHIGTEPDLAALPSSDQAAVRRALAKSPSDRFPSSSDFVRALAVAGGGNPGSGIFSFPGTVPDIQLGAETRPVPVTTVVARRPAAAAPVATPVVAPAELPVVAFVPRLRPRPNRAGDLSAAEFVEAVVGMARSEFVADEPPADGTRSCRFLCTTPETLLPSKLTGVAQQFGMSVEEWEGGAVLRRAIGRTGRSFSAAAPGELWVLVQRAAPSPETIATAGLAGELTPADEKTFTNALPGVLSAVRGAVETLRDPRSHPRYLTGFPVRLHPLGADGFVGAAEDGVCEDVSAGGVRILTRSAVSWRRVYLEFRSIEGVAGNALLANVVRSEPGSGGHLLACRFMTE